jgi:hypothetical protein
MVCNPSITIHYGIRLPYSYKVHKRGWRRSLRGLLKRLLKGIKNSLIIHAEQRVNALIWPPVAAQEGLNMQV